MMTDEFEREVIDRLARIETRLEPAADHEKRIDALEKGQIRWGAVCAVVAAALTSLLQHIPFFAGRG